MEPWPPTCWPGCQKPSPGWRRRRGRIRRIGHQRLGRQDETGDGNGILQCGPSDSDRVDHADLVHIDVAAVGHVEPQVEISRLTLEPEQCPDDDRLLRLQLVEARDGVLPLEVEIVLHDLDPIELRCCLVAVRPSLEERVLEAGVDEPEDELPVLRAGWHRVDRGDRPAFRRGRDLLGREGRARRPGCGASSNGAASASATPEPGSPPRWRSRRSGDGPPT